VPVADLDLAGDSTHVGIGEVPGQRRDRARAQHAVGVEGDHDLRRLGQRPVERGRLAAVGLPDQPHPVPTHRPDRISRAVGRAVVDDPHLEIGRVVAAQRVQQLPDHRGLVVRGDQHADRWQRSGRPDPPAPGAPLDQREHEGEHRDHDHRAGAEHEQRPDQQAGQLVPGPERPAGELVGAAHRHAPGGTETIRCSDVIVTNV
jgi:hypothetical protein